MPVSRPVDLRPLLVGVIRLQIAGVRLDHRPVRCPRFAAGSRAAYRAVAAASTKIPTSGQSVPPEDSARCSLYRRNDVKRCPMQDLEPSRRRGARRTNCWSPPPGGGPARAGPGSAPDGAGGTGRGRATCPDSWSLVDATPPPRCDGPPPRSSRATGYPRPWLPCAKPSPPPSPRVHRERATLHSLPSRSATRYVSVAWYEPRNTKSPELLFRTLLGDDGTRAMRFE